MLGFILIKIGKKNYLAREEKKYKKKWRPRNLARQRRR